MKVVFLTFFFFTVMTAPPSNRLHFAKNYEIGRFGAVTAREFSPGEVIGAVIYWQFQLPFLAEDLALYLRGASAREASCEMKHLGDHTTVLVARKRLPSGVALTVDRLRRPWYVPLMASDDRVCDADIAALKRPMAFKIGRSAYGAQGVHACEAMNAGEYLGDVVRYTRDWWQLLPLITRDLGRFVQLTDTDANAELRWNEKRCAWEMYTARPVRCDEELVLDAATMPCYVRH